MWSNRLFFINYTMKAVIKDGKILIDKGQIDINGITYIEKSSLIYNHIKSISVVHLPN